MRKRTSAAALVLLLLLAAFSTRAEKADRSRPAEALPAGAFLLFEAPDGNAFLRSLCSSPLGRTFRLPDLSKPLPPPAAGAAGWKAALAALSALDWGLALAVYPEKGTALLLREHAGKGRALLDAFLLLDPAVKGGMKEMKTSPGTWKVGDDYYLKVRGGDVFLCGSLKLLRRVSKRRHPASMADTLARDRGWEAPPGGVYFFADMTKAGDSFFSESERPLADALGLTSLATLHWSSAPEQGFYHDRLRLRPASRGWKGLPAAAPMRGTQAFDGRLSKSFFRFALSVDAGDALRRAIEAVPPQKRGGLDHTIQLYRAVSRRDLYSDVSTAFDGNVELALQLPDTGVLPHLSLSLGVGEISMARTLFDFVNSSGFPVFPLSRKVGDTVIHYRNSLGRLGVTPCCAFGSGRLLFSDSIPWLRSLLENKGEAFPPPGKRVHPMMKAYPTDRLAAFHADDRAITRWLLSLLPLAQARGVKLPFDPLDLPSADEVADMFGSSAGWLKRDGKDLSGESWSDFPMLGAAAFAFLAGRSAGLW